MRKYLAALLVSTVCASAAVAEPMLLEFSDARICNASGAVAVNERDVIVGDDEQHVLPKFDLTTGRRVANLDYGGVEADVEGGTVFQGQAVWITSHGRNKEGKVRPARQRLFASHRLADGEASPALGTPFTGLLAAVAAAAATKDPIYVRLAEAIGPDRADTEFAPKARGFNIEGLTTTEGLDQGPAREGLLVGIRNPPTSDGRAILFVVENAAELLDGSHAAAQLGQTFALDLGGRRIRDITYSQISHAYLIVGGPVGDESQTLDDGGPAFAIFRWSGTATHKPQRLDGLDFGELPEFHPEAIVSLPERGADGKLQAGHRVLLLSDDGKRHIDGKTCEELPSERQSFRGIIVTVE